MSMDAITATLYLTHTPSGEPLKASAKVTAYQLAGCTPADSNVCWPSIKTLQELTVLSLSTLHDALKTLEDCGYITRTPRVGRSNFITLNVEAMKATHRRLHHSSGSSEAPVETETVEVAPIEVEIISSPVQAVEAPQGPANAPEGTITQPVQENPVETPSEPVQGELLPAPTKPKARKSSKRAADTRVDAQIENDFIEFYTTYPLHTGRGAALRAYEKARKAGATAEEILDGCARFAQAVQATGRKKKHIKHPSTWLNAQCWLDDMDDAVPAEHTPGQIRTWNAAAQDTLRAYAASQHTATHITQQIGYVPDPWGLAAPDRQLAIA